MNEKAEIGVIGMAVMGSNLARNLAHHGYRVALFNRSPERTDRVVTEHGAEGIFRPAHELPEFVASIERPRRIILMVKAGDATDATIDSLLPLLDPDDVIMDGGNSLFTDTIRREERVRAQGFHFVGCGISGGEVGALEGPAIMPGGTRESYQILGPVLEDISAHVANPDGSVDPCCAWMGPDGAGHFVKMIHNGIEYADMQVIGEAWMLLRGAGLSNSECADVFAEWNTGDLDSYLIQITAEVLRQADPRTGADLVDVIADRALMKGTGTWTVQTALDLSCPVNGIGEAVFARATSSHDDLRRVARAARCGARRSSRTPRGSTRSAPADTSTVGTSRSPTPRASGATGASSAPAFSTGSPRPTTPTRTSSHSCAPTPWRLNWPPTSRHGGTSSGSPPPPGCRRPCSQRLWPTTTPPGRLGSTRHSPRACVTCSGRTATRGSTTKGPGTSTGPVTATRNGPEQPLPLSEALGRLRPRASRCHARADRGSAPRLLPDTLLLDARRRSVRRVQVVNATSLM